MTLDVRAGNLDRAAFPYLAFQADQEMVPDVVGLASVLALEPPRLVPIVDGPIRA